MCVLMKSMIGIKQRDNRIHIQQGAHGSNAFLVPQLLNMLKRHQFTPRDGSPGTPPRPLERFLRPVTGNASPRRASVEITWPAVPPSRCASSLAACSTSSSMSNVVLMHLMILHHSIKVNSGSSLGT